MFKPFLRLSALVAGALIGSQAYAADMPVKAAPIAPAPVMTWTGFYIGANVGYGWADVGAAGFSNQLNGVIGGGQIGYNWQAGQFVIGIEGDFQGADESRSDSGTIGGIGFTVNQDIPWFGTLRGRIGYAFDNWLVYFTGGGAWQRYNLSVTALGTTVSDHTSRGGWTVGGGVEWMFAPQWSGKVEYLYTDTGNTSVTLFGNTFTGRAQNNIVRVGINYHF